MLGSGGKIRQTRSYWSGCRQGRLWVGCSGWRFQGRLRAIRRIIGVGSPMPYMGSSLFAVGRIAGQNSPARGEAAYLAPKSAVEMTGGRKRGKPKPGFPSLPTAVGNRPKAQSPPSHRRDGDAAVAPFRPEQEQRTLRGPSFQPAPQLKSSSAAAPLYPALPTPSSEEAINRVCRSRNAPSRERSLVRRSSPEFAGT